MKILTYSVRNVLKISEVDFDLTGRNLVLIGGNNASGKSSSLKALLMAVCGKSGTDWPDVVLKEGTDSASINVELGDANDKLEYQISVTWKRGRNGNVVESFKLLDRDGGKVPEPRKLLKDLYKLKGFDPLYFQSAKPKERIELLRDLVGVDFRKVDAQRKVAFDYRTAKNREIKRLEGVMESIDPWPKDLPTEPVSITNLMNELTAARENNDVLDVHKRNLTDINEKIQECDQRIEQGTSEIERLKNAVKELQDLRVTRTVTQIARQKLIDDFVLVDTSEIQGRIHGLDAVIEHQANRKNSLETHAELTKTNKSADALSKEIEDIDSAKADAMENAKWPLEGLSMDSEGVLYNGLPFDQASTAERTLISVRMGMATNPTLRLMISEHGNDLDEESLATLQTILEEGDFQLLLEFVTRGQEDEERCAVVFTDGKGFTNE